MQIRKTKLEERHAQAPAAVASRVKFGVPSPVICARPHQHHQTPTTHYNAYRIPALRRVEARSAAAARQVVPLDDIVQPALPDRRAVQPRVEEAENALALAEQLVVDERDDRRDRRARTARAVGVEEETGGADGEVGRVRGDVGERAPVGVIQSRVPVPRRQRDERGRQRQLSLGTRGAGSS